MDAFAEQIRNGIATSGCHVVLMDHLKSIWPQDHAPSDEEKGMILKNFATQNGLMVDITPHMMLAVFRDSL